MRHYVLFSDIVNREQISVTIKVDLVGLPLSRTRV